MPKLSASAHFTMMKIWTYASRWLLGGITDGVVNIELCDAYATIANGGKYNEAKFYSRIEEFQRKSDH